MLPLVACNRSEKLELSVSPSPVSSDRSGGCGVIVSGRESSPLTEADWAGPTVRLEAADTPDARATLTQTIHVSALAHTSARTVRVIPESTGNHRVR
jgi:hypothetical protein